MNKTNDRLITKALELARRLTALADEGEAKSKDDGCVVLYSVIRDAAYRVRNRAEQERKLHEQLRLKFSQKPE